MEIKGWAEGKGKFVEIFFGFEDNEKGENLER